MATEKTQSLVLARRFLVRGRVQGVGFRWFVEREAHILQVAGWVRNNPDGSVEVLAPRVDEVEVSESDPTPGLSSFQVRGG